MRALALALLLSAAHASAAVVVKLENGLLSIQATSASVADVLAQVREKTGMKVIYDGAPPQQSIQLTLTDLTPAAAVLGVLDGRGIKYAVILNSAGTEVETLLISTAPVPQRADPAPHQPAGFSGYPEDSAAYPEAPGPYMGHGAGSPGGMEGIAAKGMPPMPGGGEGGMPIAAPPAVATPPPYSVSPFTPQGPGPVIIPMPGVNTAAAAASPTPVPTVAAPPGMEMQRQPMGLSTAELPPWEKGGPY
jgi:hypothetical protein